MSTELRFASPSRRRFLGQFGTATAAALFATSLRQEARAAGVRKPDDILFTSVRDLAAQVRAKKISAVELTEAYLARIDAVNPRLNAVVFSTRERALAEARAADAALASGRSLGPLHGVPFTAKDSHDTEGVLSTGGTLGRKNFIPSRDATSVARVRAAGAILLGKTNTPELTLSYQTSNLIYDKTHNPYKYGYQPGGSTGGGAAIIAAGGSAFDLGTDFGGSVRVPAHSCGIAGHKPTAGLVPRTGHIVDYGGVFDAFQVVGPLSRWVEDLDLLTSLIAGPDFIDAAIIPMPWSGPESVDLKALRVAWYVDNGSVDAPTVETVAAVKRSAVILQSAGLSVTEDCPTELLQEAQTLRNALSAADGREWVRRMLRKHGTLQVSPNIMSGAGASLADTKRFTEIVEQLDLNRSRLLAWFQRYDLILAPVDPRPAQPWPEEPGVSTFRSGNYGFTPVYNTTGWPGTVVRAGTSPEGLPIGVQLIARPFFDQVALAAAAVVESGTGGFQIPSL